MMRHSAQPSSQDNDGSYRVDFEQLDKAGKVLKRGAMGCKYLFMAGGSTGTTEMLIRARETVTLPALNQHVGTDWSSKGDIFTARANWRPMGRKVSMAPAFGFHARNQNNVPLFSMDLPTPFLWLVGQHEHHDARDTVAGEICLYDSKTDKAVLLWNAQNAVAPLTSTKYIVGA